MIIMNKYCVSRWDRTRPAYTIRASKYRKLERLNTSTSVHSVSGVSKKETTK